MVAFFCPPPFILAGVSGPPTKSYETSIASATNVLAGAARTFSAVDLGTPSSTRRIVVGFSLSGSTATPTITIDGQSATVVVAAGISSTAMAGIAISDAVNSSSATGDIVITAPSLTQSAAIHVWAVTNLVSITPTDTATVTVDNTNMSLDILADGLCFAVATQIGSTATCTWTGATERADMVGEAAAMHTSAADTTSLTAQTLTVRSDWNVVTTARTCGATFR
jgi:hypothetical protein